MWVSTHRTAFSSPGPPTVESSENPSPARSSDHAAPESATAFCQPDAAPSVPVAPEAPPRPTGADAYSAERLAREQACHAQPVAALAAKGPGFETYSVPCSNGDALAIRCEFGNCRVLR